MKPPRRIVILSQPFTVVYTSEKEELPTEAAFGAVDVFQSRIAVQDQTKLSVTAQVDTVLHEVLHAGVFTAGVRHTLFHDDHEAEEHTIRVLTPLLLDILRRNPALVRYLTQPL